MEGASPEVSKAAEVPVEMSKAWSEIGRQIFEFKGKQYTEVNALIDGEKTASVLYDNTGQRVGFRVGETLHLREPSKG